MQRHRRYQNNTKQGLFERFVVSVFALTLALSPLNSIAQSGANDAPGELAGRIVFVEGDVVARDSSGFDRQLSRRAPIYVGDTLFTDVGASTQIRMVDDAMISLQESTQFAIVAYDFEENPQTDRSSIELIQGGFRTITGTIGEQNRDNYEASISNFATIGIRGTDYEVVITPVGEVVTGVYDGGTTIANNLGSLDLGVGADYDYALIPDSQSPPQGLLVQPPALGLAAIRILSNDDDGDEGDDDSVADDSDDGADGTGDNAADGDDGDTDAIDDNSDANADSANNDGNTNNGNGNGGTAAPAAPNNNNAGNSNGNAGDELGGITGLVNDGQAGLGNDPIALPLTNSEIQNTDNNSNTGQSIAVIAPPTAALFATTPTGDDAGSVLSNTQQETLVSAFTTNPNENNGDGAVNCASNSSCKETRESGQPILTASANTSVNEENSDINDIEDLDSPEPTPDTDNDDDDTSGGDDSSGGDNASGSDDSSGGNNNSDSDSDDSNTSGGNSNGNAFGQDNDTTAPGNSENSNGVPGGNEPGNSNGNNGVGNGNGGSNGNNSNTAGGSNNSGTGSDSSGTNGSSQDNGSSGNNDNSGNSNSNSGSSNSNGNGNSNSNSGSSNSNGNGNSNSNSGSSNSNGNGNSSGLTFPESSAETFDIAWGSWDSPADQNWVVVRQVDDKLVRITTSEFFAELSPTPVANMTGSHSYRTGIASSFIGSGSSGDIHSLVAEMAVNFDTGAINNGSLQVLSGDHSWSVNFDGLAQNGLVELNALEGQLMDASGIISNNLEVDLGGAFTGQNAEAFVGGFQMLDMINELNHVEGIFTIER